MTDSSRAPLLSATRTRVYGRITWLPLLFLTLGLREQLGHASDASSWPAMSATFGAAAPALAGARQDLDHAQRLVALYGRLSWMRTRSPSRTSPPRRGREALRRRMNLLIERVLAHAADRDDDVFAASRDDTPTFVFAVEAPPSGRGLAVGVVERATVVAVRLRTVTCCARSPRRCALPCAVLGRTRLHAADETRGSAVAVVASRARARAASRAGAAGLTLRFLHGHRFAGAAFSSCVAFAGWPSSQASSSWSSLPLARFLLTLVGGREQARHALSATGIAR